MQNRQTGPPTRPTDTWQSPSVTRTGLWLALIVTVALIGGCGEDDESEHGIEAEACEHMIDGPARPAMATDQATSPGPDVSEEHVRHDIALVDDGSGAFVGAVEFRSGDATDYVLALDAEIPLRVNDPMGNPVTLPPTAPNEACAEVVVQQTVELPVGTSTLVFGPADVSQVSLVVERAAHDDG